MTNHFEITILAVEKNLQKENGEFSIKLLFEFLDLIDILSTLCNYDQQQKYINFIESNAQRIHEIITHSTFAKDLTDEHSTNKLHHLQPIVVLLAVIFEVVTAYSDVRPIEWQILRIRSLVVWQRSLDQPSSVVNAKLKDSTIDFLRSSTFSTLDAGERAVFLLFIVSPMLDAYEYNSAREYLHQALTLFEVDVNLAGVLGRRTRFQQKDVAQLTITMTDTGVEARPEYLDDELVLNSVTLPVNCTLQDDTIQDAVNITGECNSDSRLTGLRQVLVQAALVNEAFIRDKASGADSLQPEQMRAYFEKLLENNINDWSIRVCALHDRCLIERTETRRVERALQQSEELVNNYEKVLEKTVKIDNPMSPLTYCKITKDNCNIYLPPCRLIPHSQMKELHANLLLSLGCISEALGVFNSIRDWPNIVQCYKRLGKLDRAETLILKRLDELVNVENRRRKNERYLFLCLLGDITDSTIYYEQAWQESNAAYHRAQSSLGDFYIRRKNYAEAIKHYKMHNDAQPLIFAPLFNEAYCHMQEKNYMDAIRRYQQAVRIEPNNYEAWNNMATALIHAGSFDDKIRAHRILANDALKHSFDNWKVWENFLALSVDVGELRDALRAYNRLLELKGSYVDEPVLKQIVEISRDRRDDANLMDEIRKLFARLESKSVRSAGVYRLYAQVLMPQKIAEDEANFKWLSLMQKAVSASTSSRQWTESEASIIECVNDAAIWCRAYDEIKERASAPVADNKLSLRMSLRSIVSSLRKKYDCDNNEELLRQNRDNDDLTLIINTLEKIS